MTDEQRLAATLHDVRERVGLSVNGLAEASGVSRAMIGKIERGEAQPTAALLGRLVGALGLTMSELFAQVEVATPRLARASEQTRWTDPETGYRRRTVSPAGSAIQLVEVTLPAGATVPYPPDSYALTRNQIWVLDGHLRFHEGDAIHELDAGDCLELGQPAACAYVNPTDAPCRYLVAVTRA
jgi:transcriptional regulator with XRE-family HTH domain